MEQARDEVICIGAGTYRYFSLWPRSSTRESHLLSDYETPPKQAIDIATAQI